MKRISFSLLTAVLLLILVGCGNVSAPPDVSTASPEPSAAQTPAGATPVPSAAQVGEVSITLTVNGQEFTATLLDNETARELTAMLPLTLDMSELNGNEKYFYLDACVGAFGVTAESDFLSAHQKPISMIGGILIIAMGVIIFRKEASSIRDAGQTTNLATLFVSSFLIAIANPATILSFLLPLQPLASVRIPHLGRAFN